MDDLISIILPVYNAEHTIEKTINSVLNQSYENFELIIIDDGSEDHSFNICKSIKDERIKLIKQKNQGPSFARNRGIDEAVGTFICFLDADDTYEHNFLEIMSTLICDFDLAICSYRQLGINTNETKDINSVVFNNSHDAMMVVLTDERCGGYLWNKIFVRSIIAEHKIRFYDDIYVCEDLLFVEQYLSKCKKVILKNKELYNYMFSEKSLSHKVDIKQITVLKALLLIMQLTENECFRNAVINRFVDKYLYFYCLFGNNNLLLGYLSSFKKIIPIEFTIKTTVLQNTTKWKYFIYRINPVFFRILFVLKNFFYNKCYKKMRKE